MHRRKLSLNEVNKENYHLYNFNRVVFIQALNECIMYIQKSITINLDLRYWGWFLRFSG